MQKLHLRITGMRDDVLAYAEQRGLFNPQVVSTSIDVTTLSVNDTEHNQQVLKDWEASAIMYYDERSLGRPVRTADLPMGTLLTITKVVINVE